MATGVPIGKIAKYGMTPVSRGNDRLRRKLVVANSVLSKHESLNFRLRREYEFAIGGKIEKIAEWRLTTKTGEARDPWTPVHVIASGGNHLGRSSFLTTFFGDE